MGSLQDSTWRPKNPHGFQNLQCNQRVRRAFELRRVGHHVERRQELEGASESVLCTYHSHNCRLSGFVCQNLHWAQLTNHLEIWPAFAVLSRGLNSNMRCIRQASCGEHVEAGMLQRQMATLAGEAKQIRRG